MGNFIDRIIIVCIFQGGSYFIGFDVFFINLVFSVEDFYG